MELLPFCGCFGMTNGFIVQKYTLTNKVDLLVTQKAYC